MSGSRQVTAAEQVARALREPTMFPGHLSPRVIERCTALAEFVEAADHLRDAHRTVLLLTGEDPSKLGGATYDAALKRLAEVLG